MKKVLITGISGQDGVFLTNLLNSSQENYKIVGISREKNIINELSNKIKYLNPEFSLFKNLECFNIDLLNEIEVYSFIENFKPDFVYNLSGPSSVYDSITNPKIKIEIETIFNNLIKSLLKSSNLCNFYQASSSEIFKESNLRLNEDSEMLAKSPYAEGKLMIHNKILSLRNKYEWDIISGITFNHESEFRKDNYLIMKIINAALNIKNKKAKSLQIGSLDYIRDWSYAGDTAMAIYKVCEFGTKPTYVIGSGESNKISDILEIVFGYLNLQWRDYVTENPSLLRKGDPKSIISNPLLIQNELGWKTNTTFEDTILKCLKYKAMKY